MGPLLLLLAAFLCCFFEAFGIFPPFLSFVHSWLALGVMFIVLFFFAAGPSWVWVRNRVP